jgi:hypothetical protein
MLKDRLIPLSTQINPVGRVLKKHPGVRVEDKDYILTKQVKHTMAMKVWIFDKDF